MVVGEREIWDAPPGQEECNVCGKIELRNIDGETTCEEKAHVAHLLELYPNWEGYHGTY